MFDHRGLPPLPPGALPPALAPFVDALTWLEATPDRERRVWRVEAHPGARTVPFAPHHHHPAVKGVHWDGMVPRFPCVRLDPDAPSIGPYRRHRLRARGRALLGSDGALYSYGLDARSLRANQAGALAPLVALFEALGRDEG